MRRTLDEMIYHCKAVARGAKSHLLPGDMPMGSYEISDEQALLLGYENSLFAAIWHMKYATVGETSIEALKQYKRDVSARSFPEAKHGYDMPPEEVAKMKALQI
ncbi:hypothetical protein AYO20_00092 [Fonsecaea nubica]|uniref:3-methyl-2-oxobutanoate hydroxymethyltransferase n=1 Tax=Fonsecaea nubica TaxID=856822 RepID=A0A178DEZ7_9EURO|nr:hypothetical protein AYO20_00092 [Fonsecaea nubica]OAL40356.1 hypothetical protein AYO20_00092 [Fonsecaea nubica]